ncbi:MAG: 50S ribosomal protein L24 [Bacilli bacterium]
MRIQKGDKVRVITGTNKGTIGNVLKVYPKTEKVVVEGVNLVKKHLKPSQINPDGGIIEKEMPIHVSNVMIYDSKSKQVSRIGIKEEKGKRVRVYKKTGAVIK